MDDFSSVQSFYRHPPTLDAIKKVAAELQFPAERCKEVVAILREQNARFFGSAPASKSPQISLPNHVPNSVAVSASEVLLGTAPRSAANSAANSTANSPVNSSSNFAASDSVARNLDALEAGAVAIVTGQQVGLFGGPAYAIYKALTAIRIAEELTQAGVAAVPVFWMATEDHDLEEVRHVSWFENGRLEKFALPEHVEIGSQPHAESALPEQAEPRPVGTVALGAAIDSMVVKASSLLSGPASQEIAAMLRESYRAEETYGGAFAKLFAKLFAGQGLILLDPLDARLHRVAAPVYAKAVEQRDSLNEQLLQRGKDLERAGFEAQVKVTSRGTTLFWMANGARQAIAADGEKFRSGDVAWSREELLRLVKAEPEKFSPNALLRPVVQDFLLPTAAYLGGPAEIAYYAQSEVLYRNILGRMPVVMPRADYTLVDSKAERLLQQYELCIENLWAGPQELRRKMESVSVPAELSERFDRDAAEIEKTLAELQKQIVKLDSTLGGAVESARRRIAFQLDKLRRKTGRALDEKNGLLTAHQKFLEELLYPGKELQSRELCFLPFLARWGMNGLAELKEMSSSEHLQEHRIVRIP
jgi:bacillithiol biosynthesis cysteine-adding enzyme BshC